MVMIAAITYSAVNGKMRLALTGLFLLATSLPALAFEQNVVEARRVFNQVDPATCGCKARQQCQV